MPRNIVLSRDEADRLRKVTGRISFMGTDGTNAVFVDLAEEDWAERLESCGTAEGAIAHVEREANEGAPFAPTNGGVYLSI